MLVPVSKVTYQGTVGPPRTEDCLVNSDHVVWAEPAADGRTCLRLMYAVQAEMLIVGTVNEFFELVNFWESSKCEKSTTTTSTAS